MKLTDEQRQIVEDNIRLATGIVSKLMKSENIANKVEFEDLQQVAFLGLCKAVYGYKEEFGYKFSTYAHPAIRYECINYIERNNIIRLPRRDSPRIKSKKHEEEIKKLRLGYNIKSLDVKMTDDSPTTFLECLEDEIFNYDSVDTKIVIDASLSDEERRILKMYLSGKNQTEIGKVIGISQNSISRKIKDIRNKLAEELNIA
ncbi:RNA polymerase sigma factor, sigma-70 family [Gottschalkia purinilytica]|uniref:RNA polymerase sigma factor, sigma-70 family n=1 Tax=Gottschalkia purinilytica TaxID=1503 RepID=A0A0L0WEE5_GOTPU|nr:sigma-70 family RNA polymerase sigma factor [Gottschalkia purinilytica]KNF09839.1 RNA polymerase sigma factor, sigma-70 family [Gottschalkia purinilytica]